MVAPTDAQRTDAATIGKALADGRDDRLWAQARRNFEANTSKPKEGSKEREIYESFINSTTTVDDCRSVCTTTQEKADEKYTAKELKIKGHTILTKDWVKNTLANIDLFIQIGDVATKGGAETVSLAWSAVKIVLLAVQGDAGQCAMWAQAAEAISGILVTCKTMAKIYGRSLRAPSDIIQRLLVTIPNTYEAILAFSYAAQIQLKHSALHRMISQANPFTTAIAASKGAFDTIKACDKLMRDEAMTAFQEKTDEGISTIQLNQAAQSGDLADIKRAQAETGEEARRFQAFLAERSKQSVELANAILDKVNNIRHRTPYDADKARFEDNKKILDPQEDSAVLYRTKLQLRDPEDTCKWIFGLEEYQEWLKTEDNQLLWLYGGPGLGKSVLMSVLIDSLAHPASSGDEESPIVPFFFCTKDSNESSNTLRIKRDLVYCLYEATKEKPEWLAASNEVFSAKSESAKPNDKAKNINSFDLESAFTTLADILKRQVVVVIDALDECTDKNDEGLLPTLIRWLENQKVKIKILVSSREESDIADRLGDYPKIDLEKHNRRDIELRAESGLKSAWNLSQVERKLVQKKIVEKAKNQFTYVNLAIDQFKKPFKRPIENALNSLSSGVHALYQESLKKTDPMYIDLAEMVITWTLLRQGSLEATIVLEAYSQRYTALPDDAIELDDAEDISVRDDASHAGTDNNESEQAPDEELTDDMAAREDSEAAVNGTLSNGAPSEVDENDDKEETKSVGTAAGNEQKGEEDEEEVDENKKVAELYRGQIRAAADAFVRITKDEFLQEKHQSVRECFLGSFEPLPTNGIEDLSTTNLTGEVQRCHHCEKPHDRDYTFQVDEEKGNLEIAITLLRHVNSRAFQDLHMIVERDTPEPENESPAEEKDDQDASESPEDTEHLVPDASSSDTSEKDEDNTGESTEASESGSETQAAPDDTETNIDTNIDMPTESNEEAGEEHETSTNANPSEAGDPDMQYDAYDSEDDLEMREYDERQKYVGGTAPVSQYKPPRYEILYWVWHVKAAETAAARNKSDTSTGLWAELWIELKKFLDDEALFDAWLYSMWLSQPVNEEFLFRGSGITPLHVAASFGLRWVAERVIEDRGDEIAMHLTMVGGTPLSFLRYSETMNTDVELLELLLDKGHHPNFLPIGATWPSATFFRLLARDPSLELVKRLADRGTDFTPKNPDGETALHYVAIDCSRPELVPWLIEQGVDINEKDSNGDTPLHQVLRRSNIHQDLMEAFLDNGALVNMENKDSVMPLVGAVRLGNIKAVQLLIEHNAPLDDVDDDGDLAVYSAIIQEDVEMIDLLVVNGAPVHLANKAGMTPLYLACSLLLDDKVAMGLLPHLMSLPAEEVDRASDYGKTPLWKAAARGFTKVVEKMFEVEGMSARLDCVDEHRGRTPLHIAAWKGRTDVIEILLKHNADPLKKDKGGKTALCIAHETWMLGFESDHEGSILLLIDADEAGAAADNNLLVAAASQGSLKIVQRLLGLDAKQNVKDAHGWTPLLAAKQNGHKEISELLDQSSSAGQPPTRMTLIPKTQAMVSVDDDAMLNFTYIHDTSDRPECALVADHPIPAGLKNYYYEVEVVEDSRTSREDETLCVSVGLTTQTRHRVGWNPGWPYLSVKSWAYHSDDGRLIMWDKPLQDLDWGTWGPGTVVGCGLSQENGELFWTKDGEMLGVGVHGVAGRLFPAIAFDRPVSIKINFGADTVARPFRWAQANDETAASPAAVNGEEGSSAVDMSAPTPKKLARKKTWDLSRM